MADPDRLRVAGGIGGITARLEDLDRTAAVLRSVAAELGDRGRAVLVTAGDPRVQVTALASPLTLASAEIALVAAGAGPSGLVPLAARMEALGVSVGLAVEGYRAADGAVAAGLRSVELLGGRVAGAAVGLAVPELVPELLVGAGAGLIVVQAEAMVRGTSPAGPTLSEPLRRAGLLTLQLLADHAELTGAIVPAVPEVVGGAVSMLPGGPVISAVVFRRAGGPVTIADLATGIEALSRLAQLHPGGRSPRFRDPGPVEVQATRAAWTGPPGDLAGVVASIPTSQSVAPEIHVERVDGADGVRRWLISIPGTANWSPAPGRTPFDLTGDERLMAGQHSSGMAAVVATMRAVGVRKGEPVLLAGHSQGGLLAAATAADPMVRREFTISRVITTGAPIASIPIPDDVQVLSIEHTSDLVPQLDGSPNPDRPNWVTVTSPAPPGDPPPFAIARTPPSIAGSPLPSIAGSAPPSIARTMPPPIAGPASSERSGPLRAHRLELYQQTAVVVARSADPSIAAWRQGLSPFVSSAPPDAGTDSRTGVAGGAAWDVQVSRVATS